MPAPPTPLLVLGYGLSVAATGLGWALARRDRQHLPAALLLTTGLGSDLARRALSACVLSPAHAALGDAPFPPSLLWAIALSVALQLAYPAAVAGAALAVWKRRAAWWPVLVAALATAALVVAYPAVRGDALGLVYRVAHGLAAAVAALAFVAWARRREPMSSAGRVILFTTAAEMVCVIGPWAQPFTTWHLAHVVYSSLYAVLIFTQGRALWSPPPQSSSTSS